MWTLQLPDQLDYMQPKARRSEVTVEWSCKKQSAGKRHKIDGKIGDFFLVLSLLTHPLPFPSTLNLSLSISFTCSHSDSGSFSYSLFHFIPYFPVSPPFFPPVLPLPSSLPPWRSTFVLKWNECVWWGSWIEEVVEEEEERGIVGRRQVLYIAVSVGRYRIDRKDTRFLSKARGREREG